MDSSRRRAGANVMAGSVWESRIRFDEIRGGIKVFNGDDGIAKCEAPATGGSRRKTWKSNEGFNSILIPVRRSGDELNRKSPIPVRRLSSNGSPNKPVVGISKLPVNGNGKISPEKIEKESFDVKEIKLAEQKKIPQKTFPGNKQKLQRFIDLIMWRDFSKSALVFGVGNLVIILTYFLKNINISFISAISHMGLVYLAAIFVHISILNRRKENDSGDENCVVEEEMIQFVKRIIPFVNELLRNLKALFRGDPFVTMKMSMLLFVLAKWGSFITLWNLLKCGFVAVFTVPKLITHGEHWLKLCGSSWQLCFHKKGIVVVLFFIVWNFSSILYRVWAAFIVIVSFRYYQECYERNGLAKKGEVARYNDTVSVSSKLRRQN